MDFSKMKSNDKKKKKQTKEALEDLEKVMDWFYKVTCMCLHVSFFLLHSAFALVSWRKRNLGIFPRDTIAKSDF